MSQPPPIPASVDSPNPLGCSRCGASIQPAANFCHACGTAVPKSVPTPPKGPTVKPRKSSPKNRAALALLIVGFIGWVVYAVYDTNKPQSAQQTSGTTSSTPTAPPLTQRPKATSPAPAAVSVADIILVAKRRLEGQPTLRELRELKTELTGIPASSSGFAEAQQLLKNLDTKIQKAEKEEEKAKSSANPMLQLDVVKKSWEKGGFDAVAVWHVTFFNRGDKPIGNIQYRTRYAAETGDKVGVGGVDALLGDYTIRKIIAPHTKRTIEINDGFVNHEAARADFEVVSCEFVNAQN
jgi:hypothetical protein